MKKFLLLLALSAAPLQAAAPSKMLPNGAVEKLNCSMVAFLGDDLVKAEKYMNEAVRLSNVPASTLYRTRKGAVDFVMQYPKYVKPYAEFCGLPVPKGF